MELNFDLDLEGLAQRRAKRLKQLLHLNPDNCLDDKSLWAKLSNDVIMGVRDATDLKTFNERLYCFIYYHALNNTPTTTRSLNRMFGLVTKFKVSPAIANMSEGGLLTTATKGSQAVPVPTAYLAWVDEMFAGSPAEKEAFVSSFVARAT